MSQPSIDDHLLEQAGHWVMRLASGDIGEDELTACKAWIAQAPEHRVAFDRERALWQSLEGSRRGFASAPPQRRTRVSLWRRQASPRRLMAAAATAAAMVLMGPNALLHMRADALTETGEVRKLALPDGSTAMLDSNAAIAIHFARNERRIDLLRGEAWFEVRHGDARPFRVTARGGVTQDVGTAFAVARDEKRVTVGVTQGAVRVAASRTPQGLLVQGNHRVAYGSDGRVERLPGGVTPIAPWRSGLIVIDGVPLRAAIAQVARYRPGVTLTLADTPETEKVSGIFRIDDTDQALRTLAQMGRMRIITLPGGITILRH